MTDVLGALAGSIDHQEVKKETLRGPLAEEIDRINRLKRTEANRLLDTTGDCLPTCNLSVWMRDYASDIEQPILPINVSGRFPEWLQGTLIRNGPGKQSFGDSKFQHLFDCSAVLHRFKIEGGGCTYLSKLLKSRCYTRNEAAQRIVVTEFGTAAVPDPCKTIFDSHFGNIYFPLSPNKTSFQILTIMRRTVFVRISSVFSPDLSDNCMISVYPFGDELFALTEFPTMIRVDPATLNTENSVNVSESVNIVHHTSHPHVTEDGSVFNLGLSVTLTGLKYSIVKFPSSEPGGEAMVEAGRIEAQVATRWAMHPSYMHTFGLTPNYFVLVEQPLTVSVGSMLASTVYRNTPLAGNLKWFSQQTLIHVVDRRDGSIKTYKTEPFFFLHIINQYEENEDCLVIDICAYKDPSMIDCMYFEALKNAKKNPEYANMFRGRPIRLRIPLDRPDETVTAQILCDLGCETPRIDYGKRLGRHYRYFYAISADVDLHNPGTLIKVDIEGRSSKTWNEDGCFPSEPIFVPSPDQREEDDGVVLSALLWNDDVNKVSLLVLDARHFTEVARATFQTPGPVPKCLHGWYSPER